MFMWLNLFYSLEKQNELLEDAMLRIDLDNFDFW